MNVAHVLMREEEDFQPALCELLTAAGWSWYHPYSSRRSNPGYPDLTIWAPNRGVWWAELKRQPVRKRMTDLNGDLVSGVRRPVITTAQINTLRDLPSGRAVILVPSDLDVLERLRTAEMWDTAISAFAGRIADPARIGLRIKADR